MQADGTLIVHGIVTKQEVDRDNEICDYKTSKPYYQKRVEQMKKATDVEGMETSIMPLRCMHQLDAVGKGTDILFNDTDEQIEMTFEVVDQPTIVKVRKGVLPAFSHGGKMVKRWPDEKVKGVFWYTADPGEVSLVDLGSCPSALIQSIKSFQLVKADGVAVDVPFKHEECQCSCAECVDGNCAQCLTEECEALNCDCPHKMVNDKAFQAAMEKAIARAVDKMVPAILDKLPKTPAAPAAVVPPEDVEKKDKKTKRVAGEDLGCEAFAYVGDKTDTSTWKLPIHFSTDAKSARHVRNALARFEQTQGIPAGEKAKVKAKILAAAKKYGIEAADAEKFYLEAETKLRDMIKSAVESKLKPLAKGLWDVGRFAELCAALQNLLFGLIWERDMEQDESTIPDDLQGHIEGLLDTLVAYVGEEVEEAKETAAAANKGADTTMNKEQILEMLKATTEGDLLAIGFVKAASLASHFKKDAAHHLKKAKEYDAMAKTHGAAADAMKACATEFEKSGHSFHKAMVAHHEAHAALHKAHAEHLAKMAEKCGDMKALDDLELNKGAGAGTGEVTLESIAALMEKTVKPLQEEIAVLKSKQIVDPGAALANDPRRAPRVIPIARGEGGGAPKLEKGAPDNSGDFEPADLYAVS